jgi:segregation and condensation protein B
VEQVRGVDSSYSVSSLLERGLIEECGRLDVPGRPAIFRTTDVFLRTMGISNLDQLPPLPDMTNGEGVEKLQDAINKLQNPVNQEQMSISAVTGETMEE